MASKCPYSADKKVRSYVKQHKVVYFRSHNPAVLRRPLRRTDKRLTALHVNLNNKLILKLGICFLTDLIYLNLSVVDEHQTTSY